jgi:pimeloyl-ACP methyl ester carboxylesterase
VVAGDRDTQTKPSASEEIRAAVPRAELVTLSPAGHFGLASSHEAFGRAVGAFLDRVHGDAARHPVAAPAHAG